MKTGIIGATGYAGAELVRLLSGHPKVDKLILSSVSFEGGKIEDVYPNFTGSEAKIGIIGNTITSKTDGLLLKAEDVIASSDVVFSALPHAVGEGFASACTNKKIHYIDLSADFRFDDDEETYSAWYGKKYQFPDLHKKSVYGLPEFNRQKIKEAASLEEPAIIACPGCYPTSALLGAFPALAKGLTFSESPIIVNSITGISGGGRDPQRSFHYPECADSVTPYKIASHRHTPEIARTLSKMAAGRKAPPLIFTPHLAPLNRGILSTIYIPLIPEWRVTYSNNGKVLPASKEIEAKTAEIRELYKDFYKGEPFVRILPAGLTAATNRVRQSNFCDLSVHIDINGSILIITSAIDNMVKGAAGQAVQNMNLLFGYEETAGLEAIPSIF